MRLTFEAAPEPANPRGDVFATVERRESTDYEPPQIGFMTTGGAP